MPNSEWDTAYQMSLEGETLERFVAEGWMDVFNRLILEPLYKKAFSTFLRVEPSEPVQVIQTQMMAKMIDEIRSEVDKKIQWGKYAREQLKTLMELQNP